jgi:hypothetical protein
MSSLIMNNKTWLAGAAAVLLAAGFVSQAGAAQAGGVPRYADGKVRFDRVPGEKGFWDTSGAASLVEAGKQIEFLPNGKLKNAADAAQVAPFQPWALALYKYRQANDFVDDPMKVCIGPGNPRQMMTPGGVRFIQDANYKRMYMIFGGGNHTWRVIYMDGRDPPVADEVSATFLGLGVGKWEGETLVATSTGFNTRFWMSNGGLPHTEALTLTERFKRVSKEVLEYEVTIDDPRTYTRPWKAKWNLRWVPGDIQEQFCETGRE